jgi:hypothetical protein
MFQRLVVTNYIYSQPLMALIVNMSSVMLNMMPLETPWCYITLL